MNGQQYPAVVLFFHSNERQMLVSERTSTARCDKSRWTEICAFESPIAILGNLLRATGLRFFAGGSSRRLCNMDEPQIYTRLGEIFQDVFDEDSINLTPKLSAKDVDGWDSLTHIRLMLTVEKAFKIKLSAPEIGKLENVGDLVALIKART
ncbi:MAG: acyl carrier protein [Candidatus Acidiferrales bacterium]